jgi:hypothetical protein
MNKNLISMLRAGLAGMVLVVSATLLGAGPAAAADAYSSGSTTFLSTRTINYQPTFTYQDLAAARIARVGITPIPIP